MQDRNPIFYIEHKYDRTVITDEAGAVVVSIATTGEYGKFTQIVSNAAGEQVHRFEGAWPHSAQQMLANLIMNPVLPRYAGWYQNVPACLQGLKMWRHTEEPNPALAAQSNAG